MTPGKLCTSVDYYHQRQNQDRDKRCGVQKVAILSLTDARTSGRMAQFAVSRTYRQLLESHRPQIEAEFRVAVMLSSYAETEQQQHRQQQREETGGSAGGGGGLGTVDEPDSGFCMVELITDDLSEQVWVEIDGEPSRTEQAKEYILSLCGGVDELRIEEKLPRGFGDLLSGKLDGIEKKTGAKVEHIGRTDKLVLRGEETCVALARSLIDEECRRLQEYSVHTECMYSGDFPSEGYLGNRNLGRPLGKSSPHNSPKDSYESGSSLQFGFSPFDRGVQNGRAVTSDTLENSPSTFSVPETSRTVEERCSPRLIPHSVSIAPVEDVVAPLIDSKSVSLTNSMQKLGFSKEQVDVILRQLGPNADHNDVLGALVNQRPTKTDLEEPEDAGKEEARRRQDVSDGYPSGDGPEDESNNLRSIIIDGSNVAMSFGSKDIFACKGIEIVVDWFCERGHKNIFVFVPAWRKEASKPDTPIIDQGILSDLEKRIHLVWTPSRRINGRLIVCYDDRYIVKTAVKEDGIIVSNDNFRDLQNEQPEWRKVIKERLLMYSFVNDRFEPPDDPLGRHGPSLDNFLRKKPTMPDHLPQACPYGKKCTYGNKCKYYHADRPNRPMKSISETLKERDKNRKERAKLSSDRSGSPRFSSVSSAPIPGYVPPDTAAPTPEWHTTPLPGPSAQQMSPRRGGRIASESSALQTNPRPSGSPRHFQAAESIPQSPYSSPRDEALGLPEVQQYQLSMEVPPNPSQPLNNPSFGRASHTAPLPSFTSHSEGPSQRDMYTVPLQRYPSPNPLDRGYAQVEESNVRKRMSMPPVMYGHSETVGATPPGIDFERRSSHNNLAADFQRMGILDSSGLPLPREPQPNYGYRQLPQQYHGGEQFPGQTQPHPNHRPGEGNQGASQPLSYHSNGPYVPQHPLPSGMNSDQMMYPPSLHTSPPRYHPQSDQSPRPYYASQGPMPMTGGWHGSPRPVQDHPAPRRNSDPAKSVEEQRKYIMSNLSSRFGPEQVKAVMQRHPHETNPKMLMMYMNTNT